MENWGCYLFAAALAALSVVFIWFLIVGICVIGDAFGIH